MKKLREMEEQTYNSIEMNKFLKQNMNERLEKIEDNLHGQKKDVIFEV